MRNLESALHPRAHSTSLQSVLLARPPSLPACRSFNLDWTRHWTECCAPAVIIHRCRIVTSNASYIPILVACTAHDIFALEVPPSPRLPLRPAHLDARDSRPPSPLTMIGSPQVPVGCAASTASRWSSSSESQLRPNKPLRIWMRIAAPTLTHARCSISPPAPLSPLCVSYHTTVSCLRIACLHVRLAYRIPHTIPPCCVDTGTARPLPDTTMASIRIGLSSLNSHFACIPSYHTLSHESCRILSSQGPLPRPSFPRSRPSTPSSPHTHNQHVYPSRRHTSERPLTFSHVSFSLSLCVPDFICCSITFFFSFSFFLAFSTFCF